MKPLLISKTTFLEFLFCAKNIWLKIHKPDLAHMFQLSDFEKQLMEQGNEVDKYVQKIFPDGVVGDAKTEGTFFQPTFETDGFLVRCDVLEYDKKNKNWNLYEVKATNSIKENGGLRDHIDDITFQASVLRRAGLNVGKYFLITLNKEYVRWGDIEPEKLFAKEDVTEKVLLKLPEIEAQMEAAKEYLIKTEEPKGNCDCLFKGRSQHCSTFEYSNPQVPKYSVHDLSRIGSSKNKLQMLIEQEIFDIANIPSHFEFSDIQHNQIHVHKNDKPIIKHDEIKEALESLEFPLYFFDYETFAPAIPAFSGFRPYQRIPFQFSLHILYEENGELEHFEYLHEDFSDPTENVAKLLDKYIGAKGTIITWNKSFEAGVNKEIAERNPEFKKLIDRLNGMLYDLMDIFRAQHYVHKDFKGSTSIKKVLPVLAPHLDYKKLNISEGGAASESWWKMVGPTTPDSEKKQIAKDLKEYCGLDTFAMFEVWRYLKNLS